MCAQGHCAFADTACPPTNLRFDDTAGDQAKNWLILQNETSSIGLFQGMFEKNILTFNPGWDRAGSTLPDFDDVRDIQKALKFGADEYIIKPFDRDIMESKFRQVGLLD